MPSLFPCQPCLLMPNPSRLSVGRDEILKISHKILKKHKKLKLLISNPMWELFLKNKPVTVTISKDYNNIFLLLFTYISNHTTRNTTRIRIGGLFFAATINWINCCSLLLFRLNWSFCASILDHFSIKNVMPLGFPIICKICLCHICTVKVTMYVCSCGHVFYHLSNGFTSIFIKLNNLFS